MDSLKDPNTFGASVWYGFKVGLAACWMIPFSATGLALAITVVGIPLAMLVWTIGVWPFKRVLTTRIRRKVAWDRRDQPLDQGPKPWLV